MHSHQFENTLGTYSPTLLRIKVRRTFNSFQEISEAFEFRDDELSTFFHEFIHHAQNISTIIGLSHLDSVISLWHNIRNYCYDNNDIESIKQAQIGFKNINAWIPNNPTSKNSSPIWVTNIIKFSIENNDASPISLEVTTHDSNLPTNVNFGIAEFMESSAYNLEKFFRNRLGMEMQESTIPSIPYKLGEAISSYYNKSVNETLTIAIMLTALQHSHPHKAYVTLTQQIASLKLPETQIINILKTQSSKFIENNEHWIDSIGQQLYLGFPYPDLSLGDVTKLFFELVKENLKKRKIRQFPELDFLLTLNSENYKEKLNHFVRSFGGVMVIRERMDMSDNEPEKDTCMILGRSDGIFANQRAWEIFQAAIHFTQCHLTYDTNKKLIIHPPQKRSIKVKCPLYSSCKHNNRKCEGLICNTHPWNHIRPVGDGSDCAYQVAVFNTNLSNCTPS